jgi:pyruvate dehydrogenase E2 component (dihydrolipoamide acetyltransferase)
VASVRDHPVVRDGLVRVGKQTCLTLVIDHRAIDGITAAGFLAHVAAALDPSAG